MAVRRPAYSRSIVVKVNGETAAYEEKDGYLYLNRIWNPQDVLEVGVDVEFRFVHCNPRVRDNIGKVALMKGPWVFCLEEADNGVYLNSVIVDSFAKVEEQYDENLLGGTLCAVFDGQKIDYSQVSEELYEESKPSYVPVKLKAVPYAVWNNRGKGEMLVWMREV